MYRSVVYTSSAIKGFSEEALREVLAVSRRNNARDDVTGVLLFDSGSFLQVLEGEEKSLARVLRRIKADTRHHGVQVLFDGVVPERSFGEWSMGCATIDEEGAFALTPEAMSRKLAIDTPPVIRVMVRTFFHVQRRYAA
ncbi:BLUF domain-containing protein [Parvularcula dongshanensis]|uniref:BLUF domain-containing protein n=1 Tax=Parvularcula dongshanensis TaxID=1173995 RepID=A0A840I717_9PROT|nr:BLUF domain-containing protein [Parvularcula dongshanensis]MBB4659898.1 hypothetical protein [Parvularcula dongshanensis]